MELEQIIGVDADKPVVRAAPFYVVSLQKLVLLQVLTFGFYGIIWFYWHFRHQKEYYRDDSWPVMRSIFAVFFIHKLFGEFADKDRKTGSPLVWNSGVVATILVLAKIAMSVVDRLEASAISDVPYSSLFPLLYIGIASYCFTVAQKAANHAVGDPHGESNNRLNWVNYLFLVPGAIFMLLYLLGILMVAVSGQPL